MAYPREMLDRIAIERAAQQGVQPAGPGPSASPAFRQEMTGASADPKTQTPVWQNPAQPVEPIRESLGPADPRRASLVSGNPAAPVFHQEVTGASASPRTQVPEWKAPARPVEPIRESRDPVTPRRSGTETGRVASVMTAETFAGRMATPRLLEQLSQMPAEPARAIREVSAQVTPKMRVSILAPPAMPVSPEDMFAEADAQRPEVQSGQWRSREPVPVGASEDVESSADYAARAYQSTVDQSAGRERWGL